MPVKRRGKGVAVKHGVIRLARLEAGLSLGQVAGTAVSRQAVQQIERGEIRPSLEVLRWIADRTGRPLEQFLDSAEPDAASELAEVERLHLVRDFASAVDLAERLRGSRRLSVRDEARVLLWLGASLVGLARPGDAIGHLRRARDLAEQIGDPLCEVEALDWEACAHHLSDSPGAVAMAELALVRCRSLGPGASFLEARILGHIGSFLVRRREWKRALAAYDEALRSAAEMSDLRQLALMHHNLSITYQRLGDPAGAAREAQRGLALYSAQASRGDLARMQSDYGDLLRRQGDLLRAREHLDAAIGTFAMAPEDRGVGYTLLTLAEVSIAEGAWTAARDLLDEVKVIAEQRSEPLLQACGAQAEARLAAAKAAPDTDRLYRRAIGLFEGLEHSERAAEAHVEYADVLEARGELRAAVEHLRAAVQSISPSDRSRTAYPKAAGT